MLRSITLLAGAAALALAPARAADPQAQPPAPADQKPKAQLPVIINYPSAAMQAAPQAGGTDKKLPTVVNLLPAPAAKAQGQRANAPPAAPGAYTSMTFADNGAITSMPYSTANLLTPSYGSGFNYGSPYASGLGYTPPLFNYAFPWSGFGYAPTALDYAYTFWAQPQPLPTGVISPAGQLTFIPPSGVVWQNVGLIVR
jgi:hypothetical protein